MKYIFSFFLPLSSLFLQQRRRPAVTVKHCQRGQVEAKGNAYDFGKIPQGKPVTHIFEVTNTGNEPLILRKCTGFLRMYNPGMEQRSDFTRSNTDKLRLDIMLLPKVHLKSQLPFFIIRDR